MGWEYNDPYGAATGLLEFLNYANNDPAKITGIFYLINIVNGIIGKPPPTLLGVVLGRQIALVGGYPEPSEYAPSVGCAVMYGVLALLHIVIFVIDFSRGHFFYLTFGWVSVCLFRVIGFALRAIWSQNIVKLSIALASECLLIVATIINVSFNLILAQRLFTWRHPVGGSRKTFWFIMIGLYIIIVLLVAAVLFDHLVPYLYSLSMSNFNKYWDFQVVISFAVILYILTSIILIGLSIWAPTSKDENLYTYQPWWIKSFSTFYFPEKNAAQNAELTFMKRNSNHRHAIRVIAATHHHYNTVEGLTNERGDLGHNISMLILVISTALQLVGSIGRCIVVTQRKPAATALYPVNPNFLYITWGGLEALVQLIYIIGRVDLRFYRPDILPQVVRDIVTAQQSRFGTVTHSRAETPYDSDAEIDHDYERDYDQDEDGWKVEDDFTFESKRNPRYDGGKYPNEKAANDRSYPDKKNYDHYDEHSVYTNGDMVSVHYDLDRSDWYSHSSASGTNSEFNF